MKVTYKDLLELKMILLLTLFVNAFFLRGEELSTKRCSECKKSNMLHTFDREGKGETSLPGTLQKRRNPGH